MEGRLGAVEESLSEIKDVLKEMNSRLATIEGRESERKGAWALLVGIAATLGTLGGWLAGLFK